MRKVVQIQNTQRQTAPKRRPASRRNNARKQANVSGNVVIPGREMMEDVQGSLTFYNESFLVNIGNSDIFPRLSYMAAMWVKYRFRKLVFHYQPLSGMNTTNSVLGIVRMGVNGNPLAQQFNTDPEFANFREARSGTPNSSFSVAVPSEILNRWRYTFTSGLADLPAHSSASDYFLGLLNIATANNSAVLRLGQVFVDYVVEFDEPRAPPVAGATTECLIVNGSHTYSGDAVHCFGGTRVVDTRSSMQEGDDFDFSSGPNPGITIYRPGMYSVRYMIVGPVDGLSGVYPMANGAYVTDPNIHYSDITYATKSFGYVAAGSGSGHTLLEVPSDPESGSMYINIGSPTATGYVRWILIISAIRDLIAGMIADPAPTYGAGTTADATPRPAAHTSDYVEVQRPASRKK